MCEERTPYAQIEWIIAYAKVEPATAQNAEYIPLMVAMPLLGRLSDLFIRQLATMEPSVQDVFRVHVVVGSPQWALPMLRMREVTLSAARAKADAAAIWSALDRHLLVKSA